MPQLSPTIDHRHPWPVRLWHWASALAVGVLLTTGMLLFDVHPHLYWGDDGHEGMPAFVSFSGEGRKDAVPRTDLQIGSHHWDTTGVLGTVIDSGFDSTYLLLFTPPADWDFGATRGWHFAFAWILALGSIAYGLYLLASGRLVRKWLPTRGELQWRSVAREMGGHLRLRRARGEAARHYNLLQKLSYLAVMFLVLPAIVLSGLTLSNTVTAAFPDLFHLFGGRQSARSVHFMAALLLLLFIVVHVFEVFVAGFFKLMLSMITGRYSADPDKPA